MNVKSSTRKYAMEKRAAKAEENQLAALQAMRQLWMEMSIREITLEQVADRTGITVRTILRKFGSREGLIDASVAHAAKEVFDRGIPESGNTQEAIRILMDEYEEMGDAVIRTIRLQEEVASAESILKIGRANHRSWCEKVFAPFLPNEAGTAREEKILALVAATEVYLWKLLRRDLKKSRATTQRVFHQMVNGIISTNP